MKEWRTVFNFNSIASAFIPSLFSMQSNDNICYNTTSSLDDFTPLPTTLLQPVMVRPYQDEDVTIAVEAAALASEASQHISSKIEFGEEIDAAVDTTSSRAIQSQIEAIILSILEQLVEINKNERPCDIMIPYAHCPFKQLKFPQAYKKFTQFVSTLVNIYLSMQSSRSLSKRSLHYLDINLFPNQRSSDAAIKTVCEILGISRAQLNVFAAAKGLIQGKVRYKIEHHNNNSNSDWIDCSKGRFISQLAPFISEMQLHNTVKFVLIVEKETVYQQLLVADVSNLYNCILITGKGMPDYSTRQLLVKLNQIYPLLPLYALVDYDVYGINIYAIYKNGGKKRNENHNQISGQDQSLQNISLDPELLNVPSIQLLGISHSDLDSRILSVAGRELNSREVNSIHKLLDCPAFNQDGVINKELTEMLKLNKRVEMEGMQSLGMDYLERVYLRQKLFRMNPSLAVVKDEDSHLKQEQAQQM
jgi:meiotic recombination protein SPO11